jgi:hypothetical protein
MTLDQVAWLSFGLVCGWVLRPIVWDHFLKPVIRETMKK